LVPCLLPGVVAAEALCANASPVMISASTAAEANRAGEKDRPVVISVAFLVCSS
jgi:hypothetical protein